MLTAWGNDVYCTPVFEAVCLKGFADPLMLLAFLIQVDNIKIHQFMKANHSHMPRGKSCRTL